ncbi:50S ribosomal protein L31 [Candidatus Vidania fulgoroideorum]
MKKNIHPKYKKKIFIDINNNEKFITRSCIKTKEDNIYLDITSKSHKFFNKSIIKKKKGVVEKFLNKFLRNKWDLNP